MSIYRSARLLAPLVAAGLLIGAAPTLAQAADVILPPDVTASPVGFGPYPVGSTVTFIFSQDGPGTPVSYEYTLNGGPTQTVSASSAPSEATSVPIVIPRRQTNVLLAFAVAADGTVSGPTKDSFLARLTPPAADQDLNSDGAPDLLTVGGTKGLAAGLWLATGDTARPAAAKRGRLTIPATDIGINGNGFSGDESPSDFNGAQAISGQFTGGGFQDLLIYYPAGRFATGGEVLFGSGDGSALITTGEMSISPGLFADANGDNPIQLVNAEASIYGTGLPDLLATSGDAVNGYYLDYYATGGPGAYINTFAARTPTPDGTGDWNDWTLATLSYSGGTGMFLWDESTGALYLWAGLTPTDNGDGTGTLAFTQYKIAAHWNKGRPLATLEAADFNGDGVPDLWAVTPAGVATAYQVSHLSAHGTAVVTAGPPQKLVPAAPAAG
jgi:hypothetical protein